MKLTKLLALLLALMMVFTFVGCASDSDKDDDDDKKTSSSDLSDEELIIGKWVAELSNKEVAKFYNTDVETLEEQDIDGMIMELEFKEDGTVYSYMEIGDESDEDESEYEIKNGQIYIDDDGQKYSFKNENTLVVKFENGDISFKRDGEVKKPSSNKNDKDDEVEKEDEVEEEVTEDVSDEDLIIGKWTAVLDEDVLCEMFGLEPEELEEQGVSEMVMQLTFKKGGTVISYAELGENENEDELEYEFDGGDLYIDGEEQPYEFDGEDTLILDLEGIEVEFERD